MNLENPFTWEKWVKIRLLPLSALLFLASSAVLGTAIAEISITSNGIAAAILAMALLTIFYAIFNVGSCLIPNLRPRPTFLCVVYSAPIAIWLFLGMFEFTEVKDIRHKENSYNSSYWGEGSGLSHGCSWADAGQYPDKGSYDMTCNLLSARFSTSWVVLIIVCAIFFSFLFGPKRISDREEAERARQARMDKGKDAEMGVTEGVKEVGE
ncbi:hypothetical protein L873DRAFT_1809633 [Choiromyces venosus 120613-1]|uniref:MARVEL domain-containing protein n=1 Tax=Choiromyces venosus 120613-1 TaxID=1336337 RepID=A0A3N4JH31_9PEZI|nr:hypothetical protein L873DRAFT_1809633 [Choiromyces venosus 120613-1]